MGTTVTYLSDVVELLVHGIYSNLGDVVELLLNVFYSNIIE
jgi:hypothetical protein